MHFIRIRSFLNILFEDGNDGVFKLIGQREMQPVTEGCHPECPPLSLQPGIVMCQIWLFFSKKVRNVDLCKIWSLKKKKNNIAQIQQNSYANQISSMYPPVRDQSGLSPFFQPHPQLLWPWKVHPHLTLCLNTSVFWLTLYRPINTPFSAFSTSILPILQGSA